MGSPDGGDPLLLPSFAREALELINDCLHGTLFGELTWYFWWFVLLALGPILAALFPFILVWDLVVGRFGPLARSNKPTGLNKAVLITGCDRGFGRDLAERLSTDGWKVYAGCLTQEGRQYFNKKFPILVQQKFLVPLKLDVTNVKHVQDAMACIEQDNPETGLYCLVNNAGIGEPQLLDATDVEDYRRVMEVNFFALIAVIKAALPLLKKSSLVRPRARIVNVTSMAGVMQGAPLMSAYVASKHAAEAFSSSIRGECMGWNIYVSTICPSFHRTQLALKAHESFEKSWSSLPPEARDQYGEEWKKKASDYVNTMVHGLSWNPDNVVGTMYEAVVGVFPRRQYLVGLDAKFSGSVLAALPPRVYEWFLSVPLKGWTLTPAKVIEAELQRRTENARKALSLESDDEEDEDEDDDGMFMRCEDAYDVGKVLGQGAFATVREGIAKQTGKKVALRIIPTKSIKSHTTLRMLRTELRVLNKLQSVKCPYLVRHFKTFEDMDRGWVQVFEHLGGGDLFDHIIRVGTFTEQKASLITEQLVEALGALHKRNILHRDVKPENCIFAGVMGGSGDEDILKLGDFGLSVIVKDRSQRFFERSLAGTPPYMSPEVIDQTVYSPASDIWAAGVVLYILLCGRPPLEGDSQEELFHNIRGFQLMFREPVWDDVSPEAKDLVLEHPFISKRESLPSEHRDHLFQEFQKFSGKTKFKAVAKVVLLRAKLLKVQEDGAAPITGSPGSARPALIHKRSDRLSYMSDHQYLKSVVPSDLLTKDDLDNLRKGFEARAAELGEEGLEVGFPEFKEIVSKAGVGRSLPLEKVFNVFDVEGMGKIKYQEFLLASGKASLRGEEAVRFCFDVMDLDHSGSLSKEELAKVMIYMQQQRAKVTTQNERLFEADPTAYQVTECLAKLFERLDVNGDGEISWDEFSMGLKQHTALVGMIMGLEFDMTPTSSINNGSFNSFEEEDEDDEESDEEDEKS